MAWGRLARRLEPAPLHLVVEEHLRTIAKAACEQLKKVAAVGLITGCQDRRLQFGSGEPVGVRIQDLGHDVAEGLGIPLDWRRMLPIRLRGLDALVDRANLPKDLFALQKQLGQNGPLPPEQPLQCGFSLRVCVRSASFSLLHWFLPDQVQVV